MYASTATLWHLRTSDVGEVLEGMVRRMESPWAELLARTFAVDVLACPTCQGRMKLLALVKDPKSLARTLSAAGEATELPRRSPGRGPP